MGRTCWRILEFSFGGGPEASPLPHHCTTIPSPFLAGFLEGTYQKDMFNRALKIDNCVCSEVFLNKVANYGASAGAGADPGYKSILCGRGPGSAMYYKEFCQTLWVCSVARH